MTRALDVSGRAYASGGRGILGQIQTGLTELSNYIEDDWNDNSLTSRSNTVDGVFAHPDANEAGDVLIGRYRPEWNVTNGSPTASSGVLNLNNSSGTDTVMVIPSNMSVGSWQYDWTLTNTDTSNAVTIQYHIMSQTTTALQDGYESTTYYSGTVESWHLDVRQGGGSTTTIINGSNTKDTNTHTREVTRDSYSNWEMFNDGVSAGTANDSTFTSGEYEIIYGQAGTSDFTADNLVVN